MTFKAITFSSIWLASVYLSTIVQAKDFQYPGGIVDLTLEKTSSDLPVIKYGLHETTIIDQGTHWRILVGISLDTLPGEYLLYVKHQTKDSVAFNKRFHINQKSTAFLKQEEFSSQTTTHNYDHFSDIDFTNSAAPEIPLRYPAKGQWANYFGAFDNSNTRARNFISLTTAEQITVVAPQNAIVTRIIENPIKRTSQRNDSSRTSEQKANYTLFLDHGRGLYSILSGLMDITVETGNGVLAGNVLGKVHSQQNALSNQSSTLIWQTVLNDAYVNPTILTQLR